MTWTQFVIIVASVWLLTGIVSALVMHRHGHRWFTWFMLGATFGPLVLPLLPITLGADRAPGMQTLRRGLIGAGDVNLVAGIDGSPASVAAIREAIRLSGDDLRSVTLVEVLDQESRTEDTIDGTLDRCVAELGALPNGVAPELVHAFGPPVDTLVAAARGRNAILVLGEHGRGLAPLGLGTVTKRIRSRARGPYVIIGGLLDHARSTADEQRSADA